VQNVGSPVPIYIGIIPGLKIHDKQTGASTGVAKGDGVTRTANTGIKKMLEYIHGVNG